MHSKEASEGKRWNEPYRYIHMNIWFKLVVNLLEFTNVWYRQCREVFRKVNSGYITLHLSNVKMLQHWLHIYEFEEPFESVIIKYYNAYLFFNFLTKNEINWKFSTIIRWFKSRGGSVVTALCETIKSISFAFGVPSSNSIRINLAF